MVVGGWGLQSHFHVQPNNCVEVVLRCVDVGVVTIEYTVKGKGGMFLIVVTLVLEKTGLSENYWNL